MTKKEMQLELWKAMHGMVIPMPFLKDIPEADMKSFREIYDNPKKNRQLACAAETEDLLAVLARRNYSYAVHCAFCLLALNFESIDDSCLPMFERVFYRHKAGLEARGKRWFKKRCGCN